MSLVRGLVLLHLSATSILLVLLVAVMACQRTAGLVRSRRAARRTAVVAQPQQSGASVLEWTRDLRTPADSGSSKRGNARASTGKAKSIGTTSIRRWARPSSGTLRHPHLAGLGDRLPDAGERLDHVQPTQPLEQLAQTRPVVRVVRVGQDRPTRAGRRADDQLRVRQVGRAAVVCRRHPNHGQIDAAA